MLMFDDPKVKPPTKEERTKAEIDRYEERFKNYSERKLQKIVEDENYADFAREAARNLLRRK